MGSGVGGGRHVLYPAKSGTSIARTVIWKTVVHLGELLTQGP